MLFRHGAHSFMLRLLFALASTAVAVTASGSDVLTKETKHRLAGYGERIESELRQNILPFWLEHARDRERGGFFGQFDDGTGLIKEAPRGALLTARILWTFSAAYRRYPEPKYLEMARCAYDDLLTRFWDKDAGGLFWSITANGEPLDPRKIVYVQSFGIYSLSEYHLATGDREPLDRAIELYRTLERQTHDREHRGYFEEFSREWKKLQGRGPRESAMGSRGQKSQNTHLHLLEAYTNLLRAWSDPLLKASLTELVEVMLTKVLDPSTHHLHLFFNEDWSPSSHEFSYGHDIEFSWLITEATDVLANPTLAARAKQAAVSIAEVILKEGVEPGGGVAAEGGLHGVTNAFKEWWTQAEAAVGFANAFQLSGTPAYLDASLKTWDYIDQHLIDKTDGEWFIGRSGDGTVPAPVKISFWKCPYHNGRACLELIHRLRAIADDH